MAVAKILLRIAGIAGLQVRNDCIAIDQGEGERVQ
jgi:hypothetical protein